MKSTIIKKPAADGNYEYPPAVRQACAEIIVTVADISKQPSTNYNPDDLHARFCAGFDAVIRQCRLNSLPDDAARELLYPLAALADETVLSIPQCRFYWSERPLQLRYFGEITAGTGFFTKLDAHIKAVSPQKEVLELYFMSLALGLRGMYGVNDPRRCQKVFERLGVMLKNMRRKDRGAADPSVLVDKGESTRRWNRMVPLVYPAIAFLMTAAAAVVYFAACAGLLAFLDNL